MNHSFLAAIIGLKIFEILILDFSSFYCHKYVFAFLFLLVYPSFRHEHNIHFQDAKIQGPFIDYFGVKLNIRRQFYFKLTIFPSLFIVLPLKGTNHNKVICYFLNMSKFINYTKHKLNNPRFNNSLLLMAWNKTLVAYSQSFSHTSSPFANPTKT
jgi:hypothetical protein